MALTKLATEIPVPTVTNDITVLYIDGVDVAPPTLVIEPLISTGDKETVPTNLQKSAVISELVGQAGAGAIGIFDGLVCSISSGLTLSVAVGTALIGGPVQLYVATTIVMANNTTNYVWLKRDGTLYASATLTAPSGGAVYLANITTSAGAITVIDNSGVIYIKAGIAHRQTADITMPLDTPDSDWRGITKTLDGEFLWTGTKYIGLQGYNQARSNITAGLTLTNGATNYLPIAGATALTATEADIKFKLSKRTTFKNLRVYIKTVGVTVGNCVITVRENGSDQTLTITINSGSSTGWLEDITHSFSSVVGDEISIKIVGATTGSPIITSILIDEVIE